LLKVNTIKQTNKQPSFGVLSGIMSVLRFMAFDYPFIILKIFLSHFPIYNPANIYSMS
jgi:uncharacterized membrane protein